MSHTICLLPLGMENHLLDDVRTVVSGKFDLPVDILMPEPVPPDVYDGKRKQYYSTEILKILQTLIPGRALRLLAVTNVDLYIPTLNYIFGEAVVGGRVGIISTYRLRPEHYGEPRNDELVRVRTVKEAVHELGHTFGLHHCGNPRCVMCFSNDVWDADRKSASFLAECAELLSRNLSAVKAAT